MHPAQRVNPQTSSKPIVYVDMDGVLANFEKKAHKIIRHYSMEKWAINEAMDKISAIPHFFLDLEPIPGAIEGFHKLHELYEPFILTTAVWNNPSCWSDKRLWVEKHLGNSAKKRLILTHNKGLLRGSYLIDDRIKNGVEHFDGEHIHFGTAAFPDWEAVLRHLKCL